jgi:hypothetical protein
LRCLCVSIWILQLTRLQLATMIDSRREVGVVDGCGRRLVLKREEECFWRESTLRDFGKARSRLSASASTQQRETTFAFAAWAPGATHPLADRLWVQNCRSLIKVESQSERFLAGPDFAIWGLLKSRQGFATSRASKNGGNPIYKKISNQFSIKGVLFRCKCQFLLLPQLN